MLIKTLTDVADCALSYDWTRRVFDVDEECELLF
jgi:hypothetical protein